MNTTSDILIDWSIDWSTELCGTLRTWRLGPACIWPACLPGSASETLEFICGEEQTFTVNSHLCYFVSFKGCFLLIPPETVEIRRKKISINIKIKEFGENPWKLLGLMTFQLVKTLKNPQLIHLKYMNILQWISCCLHPNRDAVITIVVNL